MYTSCAHTFASVQEMALPTHLHFYSHIQQFKEKKSDPSYSLKLYLSPLCSLSATVPLCIMLHNRWQQPCSGWGHCLGCQKHLTCQLGRRMNSRTNCCQGQILPECVCVNTGILVHLARGVNADEVGFGYCICTVVNITGERKKSFCATANLSSSRCTWRYVRSVCWASCRLKGGGGKRSVVQSNWYIVNRVGFLSVFCG